MSLIASKSKVRRQIGANNCWKQSWSLQKMRSK